MIDLKACLVVHDVSVPYVRNVLVALKNTLNSEFEGGCEMVTCSTVDEANSGDADVIFVVGENLGRFERQSGRKYVYFNFSVVAMLGNPLRNSLKGIQLIRYKNKLLKSKLDLFDAVIDYYPAQTSVLKKQLDLPVAGFVPWVPPAPEETITKLSDRAYDVCFVGGLSPRREQIIEALKSTGCHMSPSSGVTLEEVAVNSRCTLNIHMQRSNHLEIPRVMASLANGSPLVTESSYGIRDMLPEDIVYVAPYPKLTDATLNALKDLEALEKTAQRAYRWYCDVGAPQFEAKFVSALHDLDLNN